jgi:squalene-hopene/tetraprenyl-beta-curcumene cyclase
MSLAGIGLAEHPVARRGLEFIVQSMRPDGSWPIDTNLATWVTTLSINALEGEVGEGRAELIRWLLDQQYRDVHPYTNADPGGWAWTDLSGGVPDSDDTPGAMLALLHLNAAASEPNVPRSSAALEEIGASLKNAAGWLLDLQNRDGGWPTFCRGWGALPFDRSAPDLTAHALRALDASRRVFPPDARTARRIQKGLESGFAYLARTQRKDGSWLPLWFGNQLAPDDENPTYGTSRVLAAYRDCNRTESEAARRGLDWLAGVQNVDGGWGGGAGIESSVEETALAADLLWGARPDSTAARRGACWLMDCVEDGRVHQSSPIGFYFAKLWYYERLYPLIFTVAALGRACRGFQGSVPATAQPQPDRLTQETHP